MVLSMQAYIHKLHRAFGYGMVSVVCLLTSFF
jgi:hypothetical protein